MVTATGATKWMGVTLLLASVAGLWLVAKPQASSWEYTSSPYRLGQVFLSMEGPGEVRQGIKLAGKEDELLWLTGYEAIMVDEAGDKQLSQEFMCHNSLFLDSTISDYRALLGTRVYGSPRVFTLAQGAYRIELPPGFAIPFPSRQALQLQSQVLNLVPEHVGQAVRHKIRSEFVADRSLWRKPRPLFLVEATGRALLKDPASKVPSAELPARGRTRTDGLGRVTTGHWQVPPGVHENVTRVTTELSLPFDTTVHYATSHLHPYARWQELRDLTTGTVVYRVEATSSTDGRSLVKIPAYSSTQGLALFANHDYELATEYENTTSKPVTAMSILFLYCWDKEFQGYDPARSDSFKPTQAPAMELDDLCSAPSQP